MGRQVSTGASHRQQWETAARNSVRRPQQYADPDNADTFDGAQVDSDEEEVHDYRSSNPATVRKTRPEPAMEDPFYEGKVTSRADLESASESDDDDDDVLSQIPEGDEANSSEGDDEEASSDSDSDSDVDDEDMTAVSRVPPSVAAPFDMLAHLESEDASAQLFRQTEMVDVDLQKAEHVRCQRSMFDAVLHLRISLQQPMQLARRIPQLDALDYVVENDAAIGRAVGETRIVVRHVLADLLDLEANVLLKTNLGGLQQDRADPTWSLDELWATIDGRFRRTKRRRDSLIDRWNRRVALTTTSNKGFKALNRSVVHQIESSLADLEPLRKRAMADRHQLPLLCAVQQSDVYEDTDFYHTLLKDLIGQESDSGRQDSIIAKRAAAVATKKVVDRKASKGRKIRYVVHPNLVSFMAPVDASTIICDYDVDHLFANLFA